MFILNTIPTEPDERSARAEVEARQRREAEAESRLGKKPSTLESLWARFDVFIIGCAVLGGIAIAVVAGVIFITLRNNLSTQSDSGEAAQPAEVSDSAETADSQSPSSPTYSPTFIAANVEEFDTFTVYWNRDLWQAQVSPSQQVEDFEGIASDYGALEMPYLTPAGMYLTGSEVSAQIYADQNDAIGTGNLLHFRFGTRGMTFHFPDNQVVSAFGFDYRPAETWQLTIGHDEVDLPGQRRGFIGVVATDGNTLSDFTLISDERAQGGISVDNIAYIPSN